MLIRTRVILITLTFGLVIVLGVAVERQLRERLVREQFAQAATADRATLWRKTVENIVQRMEDKAWIVAEDAAVQDLVAAGDRTGLAARAGELMGEIRAGKLATRLDIAGPGGELYYSSSPSLFPTPILSPAATREALVQGLRQRGIGNDAERNVAVAIGVPLRKDGRIVGAATLATHIEAALLEMKASTGTEVLFVNRRYRALAGTAPALWERLAAQGTLELARTVTVVDLKDSVQALVMIPVAADLGNLLGWLVMAKDITASHRQQERLGWIAASLMGLFILVLLAALYAYLRRALAPLGQAVGVLNSLAQGDMSVHFDAGRRRDEVGGIGEAVNRLRKELMAFARLRRAREKQRGRQERFIRREMAGLAATLDDAARAEVMAEIEEIETRIEAARRTDGGMLEAQGAEGLSLMALVFEKMAARVRDQQARMGELIAELRTALETRTAYLALQQELEIARRVQLSSLPEALPPVPELELVGRMLPAREVGGDFYDFFELDAHRIGIVIGDVSGKGVPAALFMAISRTLLRALAQRYDRPGDCLARLNDLLVQNNQEELFVTVFYGILDRRTGELIYANGGHNPPVLVTQGEPELLARTGGIALAALDGLRYADRSVQVHPGDTLLLYTDGITEAVSAAGLEYGVERLAACLAEAGPSGATALLDRLIADVQRFAGTEPQADDITCVALRFFGALADAEPRSPPQRCEDQWSAANSVMATS